MTTQPHCGGPQRSACVALASQLGGSLRGDCPASCRSGEHSREEHRRRLGLTCPPTPSASPLPLSLPGVTGSPVGGEGRGRACRPHCSPRTRGQPTPLEPWLPPLASYGPGPPGPRLGLTSLHFAKSTHFWLQTALLILLGCCFLCYSLLPLVPPGQL